MKKSVSFLLLVIMVLSLCACGAAKKQYFPENARIPMPVGMEPTSVEKTDYGSAYATNYSYFFDEAATAEEMEEYLAEYLNAVSEEGTTIKFDGEITYEMFQDGQKVGFVMPMFTIMENLKSFNVSIYTYT